MMNHPDKMMLSAQMEGSAEESLGNPHCRRSCQGLVQLNSNNSKAEAPFTSAVSTQGTPKGEYSGKYWSTLIPQHEKNPKNPPKDYKQTSVD